LNAMLGHLFRQTQNHNMDPGPTVPFDFPLSDYAHLLSELIPGMGQTGVIPMSSTTVIPDSPVSSIAISVGTTNTSNTQCTPTTTNSAMVNNMNNCNSNGAIVMNGDHPSNGLANAIILSGLGSTEAGEYGDEQKPSIESGIICFYFI
uniref:Transcription factor n=1 Tax=Echinostoma caproni TaxID=27848 RepID=A0A183BEY6_9TREM